MNSFNPSRKGFQKLFFVIVFSLLMLVLSPVQASDLFPVNTWVTMRLPQSRDPSVAFKNGADHVSSFPIQLEPNKRYTLKVNWGDGKSRVVSVLGFNPITHNYPNRPPGTTSNISVNVGGSNIIRDVTFLRTFTTDSSSPGNVGYVTFIGRTPNQEVRVMVTDPAEPDEEVLKSTHGQITPFNLYLRETMELDTTSVQQGVKETAISNIIPLNQWVEATLPPEISSEMKYRGGKYHVWVMPVQIEKGGEYTFMARWDDKNSRLISVLGFNPLTHNYPSVPKGMTSIVSINVGSGNPGFDAIRKRNFSINPNSEGSIAYVVFSGRIVGQKIEFFIASPKESDEEVLAVINGMRRGQVINTPLHVRND